jgi:hypothetical protein
MDRNALTLPSNSNPNNTINKLNVKGIIMSVSNIISSQIVDVFILFRKDRQMKKILNNQSFIFFLKKNICKKNQMSLMKKDVNY